VKAQAGAQTQQSRPVSKTARLAGRRVGSALTLDRNLRVVAPQSTHATCFSLSLDVIPARARITEWNSANHSPAALGRERKGREMRAHRGSIRPGLLMQLPGLLAPYGFAFLLRAIRNVVKSDY
jgi:hypothetical protein